MFHYANAKNKRFNTGINVPVAFPFTLNVGGLVSAQYKNRFSMNSLCETNVRFMQVARGKSHPKNSHVWFPNWTLTVLPAPRFSPSMVTFVPPDSGPRLGDRPVTVGVYQTEMQRKRG